VDEFRALPNALPRVSAMKVNGTILNVTHCFARLVILPIKVSRAYDAGDLEYPTQVAVRGRRGGTSSLLSMWTSTISRLLPGCRLNHLL
jgi:hypothetical protein